MIRSPPWATKSLLAPLPSDSQSPAPWPARTLAPERQKVGPHRAQTGAGVKGLKKPNGRPSDQAMCGRKELCPQL